MSSLQTCDKPYPTRSCVQVDLLHFHFVFVAIDEIGSYHIAWTDKSPTSASWVCDHSHEPPCLGAFNILEEVGSFSSQ